jgi:tol-pal system protein YbgF
VSTQRIIGVLALCILFSSSCVTTSNIQELQSQITALKDEVAVLKRTSLDTKATTGANYDSVMEEVKKLRGSFEEKQYDFDQKSEEIAILKEVVNRTTADIESRLYDIEQRLAAIESKLNIKPSTEPAGAAPTSPDTSGTIGSDDRTGPSPTGTPLTAEELYAAAYKKFQDKDYDGAVTDFAAFIKASPDSSLADNAQFWIGESYYARKDYDRAILEYDSVIKKYPSGDKVPAAMLKEGLAFLELGDKAHAKTVLADLVKKYPKEPQAETARKKLETL